MCGTFNQKKTLVAAFSVIVKSSRRFVASSNEKEVGTVTRHDVTCHAPAGRSRVTPAPESW